MQCNQFRSGRHGDEHRISKDTKEVDRRQDTDPETQPLHAIRVATSTACLRSRRPDVPARVGAAEPKWLERICRSFPVDRGRPERPANNDRAAASDDTGVALVASTGFPKTLIAIGGAID
jgi:hypothetical protein